MLSTVPAERARLTHMKLWRAYIDWYATSTLLRGPEATAATARAMQTGGLRLGRLLLLTVWWLFLMLYVVVAGWYALRGRWEEAAMMLAYAAVLVFLRWLWCAFRRNGREARARRAMYE